MDIQVTPDDLRRIAAKASPIFERLQGTSCIAEPHDDDKNRVDRRLARWCQKVAGGNWELFTRRLAQENTSLAQVRPVLGTVGWKEGEALPAWTAVFQEALSLASSAPRRWPDDPLFVEACSSPASYPFAELLYPFVLVARRRVKEQTAVYDPLLTAAAATQLERNLLHELCQVAARALYLEFSLYRARTSSSLQRLVQKHNGQTSTQLYRAFVANLCEGKLLAFFQEYAVLARLLSTISTLWVEAHSEFLQRLSADLPAIQQTFCASQEPGQVVDLQPACSDYHNGRRAVMILTFACGQRVVYKPKDLGMAQAFLSCLNWLNSKGAPLPFKTWSILPRQGYGWVTHLAPLPCADKAAARRFYRRTGMLLGLMYTLEGLDCFYENLVAHGEHLLLLDMEALLHNNYKLGEDYFSGAQKKAIDLLWWNSVFRVGLLPDWKMSRDKKVAYDISGLRPAGEGRIPYSRPVWHHANSDAMSLGQQPITIQVAASVPRLNGNYLKAADYSQEIVSGFRQIYCFLERIRPDLLNAGSPLQNLALQKGRYISRNTKFYKLLLQALCNPQFLRDGVDRSIELDILSRLSLDPRYKGQHWPLVPAETAALEQVDIPYFQAQANGRALTTTHGQVVASPFFTATSIDNVAKRLASLHPTDLQTQIRFIKSALHFSVASGHHRPLPAKAKPPPARPPLTASELIAEALAIAAGIKKEAFFSGNGTVTWIAPQLTMPAQKYTLQPLRLDLYGGVAGVALFLAALESVTDESGYRETGMAALRLVGETIGELDATTLSRDGYTIGGVTGVGSLVYALTRIAGFLDEPALLRDAGRAAAWLSRVWITADTHFDITSGAAGAILGLLALYSATKETPLLEQAAIAAHHLLQNREPTPQGFRSWKTSPPHFPTGFAHGAAGIAYALLRLHEAAPNRQWLQAAEEAIAYERSVFVAEAKNWPDFRQQDGQGKTAFMAAWCHGAPGIGLARIGGLSALDTPAIRQEIGLALDTTTNAALHGRDHLCCGNLGRIEILQVAAQLLSQQKWHKIALEQAARIVHRAKQRGAYYLFDPPSKEISNPTFFQGTAGIGYTLLRLAHPGLLPSVLLLA